VTSGVLDDFVAEAIDGSQHKSPSGGEGTGKNPTDRARQWARRSKHHIGDVAVLVDPEDAAAGTAGDRRGQSPKGHTDAQAETGPADDIGRRRCQNRG
jgi:hypothetical protein